MVKMKTDPIYEQARADIENAKKELADLLELAEKDLEELPGRKEYTIELVSESEIENSDFKDDSHCAAVYNMITNKFTFKHPYKKSSVTHEVTHYLNVLLTCKRNSIYPKTIIQKTSEMQKFLGYLYFKECIDDNHKNILNERLSQISSNKRLITIDDSVLISLCRLTIKYFQDVLDEIGADLCKYLIHGAEKKDFQTEKGYEAIAGSFERMDYMANSPFLSHQLYMLDKVYSLLVNSASKEKKNFELTKNTEQISLAKQAAACQNDLSHVHADIVAKKLVQAYNEKKLSRGVIKKTLIDIKLEPDLFDPIIRHYFLVDEFITGKTNYMSL